MNNQSNFIELKNSKKIWAIGSIHSRLESFESIKKFLINNFANGDRLIFLGNIIGVGKNSVKTLTSVIDLRNKLLSKFSLPKDDIVFLRGAQEEMFLKLLQLQTAPNPLDIVEWIFDHGVNKSVESYGFNIDEVLNISTQGTLSISKWTTNLNKSVFSYPGHKEYYSNLFHATYTDTKKILFLNRGVDVTRPLSAQNDCFWWGYQNFSKLIQPYNTFVRIVRGYQSSIDSDLENAKHKIVCSLFRQPLDSTKIISGVFDDSGEILDIFESS